MFFIISFLARIHGHATAAAAAAIDPARGPFPRAFRPAARRDLGRVRRSERSPRRDVAAARAAPARPAGPRTLMKMSIFN